MRLNQRVALITGGVRGLGLGIAQAFAREGARICIANRHVESGQSAAAEIYRAGGSAMAVSMDVCDEAQVEQAFSQCAQQWGGVDILVSNAGVQHIEPLRDLALEDWQRMLAVHLDGAFLTTRAAMRSMEATGRGGNILYIGSLFSITSARLKAPYVTAKHGLVGLCQSAAREGVEHGIRCNIIEPGFIRTELLEKQIPEQAKALGISEEEVIKRLFLADTVDGCFTTVEEVAEAAVFFASYPTSALTGQSLAVSHGMVMH
jgi:3-hydroxybutyrate dehydrogenase